jgi:hypothetical protein
MQTARPATRSSRPAAARPLTFVTCQVVQIYSCLDKIHRIEWSPNSRYVLCGLYDRATVQVWALDDPDWACKIDEGPAGVAHCRWCASAPRRAGGGRRSGLFLRAC